jgi:Tfp pilus assembly protein PilP
VSTNATPQSAEHAPKEETSSFLSELRSSDKQADFVPLPTRRKRRVPLHLVVAAGVLVVGLGSLATMRQIGMKAGMTFETDASFVPVDTAASKEGNRLSIVMAELENSQKLAQQDHARPAKNPFSLASKAFQPAKEEVKDDSQERAAREEQERLRRQQNLETALNNLKLNGIVGGGGKYLASIGDKTFRIGDTVDEIFVITGIDGRTVTVAVDEQLYELTIGQTSPKAVGKRSNKKSK